MTNNENLNSIDPGDSLSQAEAEAIVNTFIESAIGDKAKADTANSSQGVASSLTSPTPTKNREEYARQADLAARLRGENNPHFD